MKKYRLNIELIPDGCWKSNLRNLTDKRVWDIIRKEVYRRAGGKCEICGKEATSLEAHEMWDYDEERGIQKLVGIIAVCKDCHSVIHIERTRLYGDIIGAEEHFMKVNNCSYAEYRKALGIANETQQRRNKVGEWSLDISYLKDFFIIKTNQ